MKRKNLILAIFAAMLVLGLSVGNAWSYFTDTASAEGGMTIVVEPTSRLTEEYSAQTKKIRIQNTSAATSVWVRARVYANASLGAKGSGTNWSGETDGWYEYTAPVAAGAETDELVITFDLPDGFDPEKGTGAKDGDELNVIVTYQCTPVQYAESGDAMPATWNE